MIKEFINKWEENKHKLEDYFRNNPQENYDEYEDIVKKIFEIVINKNTLDQSDINDYNFEKLEIIDHGYYRGTQIFILPRDTSRPDVNDYVFTHNHYGSCSGCDTLLSISRYDDGFPSENQIKEYMDLSLHLIQNMEFLINK